jgi:3-deoxy-D-manno-octulosonic-acid transferase
MLDDRGAKDCRMAYLLNFIYLAAIVLAFPWLLYQRIRHGKYREGWDAKFWGRLPQRRSDKPCIWLHAVSVGEVNLLEPILNRWERLHPDWDCVISTTTQSGYHLARKKYAPRTVVYSPLDFTWAVRRAMRRMRPTLLVLTELELWPNLIAAAKQCGAKVAVVNGRLSEKSFRGYRRLAWLVQRVLSQVDLIAVQNNEYAQRFCRLGARTGSVHVTGSIKFDGARMNRSLNEVQRLSQLAGISPEDVVFLAGSTQDPEEAIAVRVFERLSSEFPRLRLILVPRHPERFDEVAALLDRSRVRWQRRSKLDSSPLSPRILLVDAVGELGYWWGTARIAFVGGSLTHRGGQNMIEPAGYGAAISFGPNTWNFRDVVALLLDRNAAVVVRDQEQLEAFVRRCLAEPACADDLGRRAQELVLQQQGAADRTIELLDDLLNDDRAASRRDQSHDRLNEQKIMKKAKDRSSAPATLRFLRFLWFNSRCAWQSARRGQR